MKNVDSYFDHSIDRRGVTLVEVLVSMMIMSIGVLLVMSLFPVAALRTLQATQLTNATILAYNVEALLDQSPRMVFDPDFDLTTNHTQQAANRNYVVDPLGFHVLSSDGFAAASTQFGNDGAATPMPVAGFSIPRFDGGLALRTGSGNADALRLHAQNLASHDDGWTTEIDTFATGVEIVGGEIVGVKLGGLSEDELKNVGTSETLNVSLPFVGEVPDPVQYRIVLFDVDEQLSQAFPLTYLDLENPGNEVGNADGDIEATWSESAVGTPLDFNDNGRFDTRPLPSEFGGSVGRVLLQARRSSEFTWILTVRRRLDGDARSVDVVVRFRNGVDALDEELFPANFEGGTNVVGVATNGGREPRLKRGGFVFDIVNAVWYRITSIQEKPAFPPASPNFWDLYDYRLTVEKLVRTVEGTGSDFTDDQVLNGSDGTDFGRAMFPPGVVDVFPLGSKTIPNALR